MKINAVISKPSINVNYANKTAILSAVIIALGIICGTIIFLVSDSTVAETLFEYFISFTTDFTNKNKPEILSGLILSHIPYFIVMIILGVSIVGVYLVPVITLIKSIGIGMLITYIYQTFMLKGIEYCLLVLFPGKFIMLFAMILLSQNCLITSNNIRLSAHGNKDRVVELDKYILRTVFIAMIILVSSTVDFITIISFSSLFDFT